MFLFHGHTLKIIVFSIVSLGGLFFCLLCLVSHFLCDGYTEMVILNCYIYKLLCRQNSSRLGHVTEKQEWGLRLQDRGRLLQ